MDSGNNSGSLQSSSGGGDEEFDSRTFFTTASAAKANNNDFGISNTITTTTTTNNNNFPFFDSLNFLDPASPFPLLDPRQPATAPAPAPAPAPANPLSSPRTSSKKRSRASRRAPTTVLTTDTSNFRAMVQEFTGIPAPPFASSSGTPYPPPRFNFFNPGGGGGGSGASPSHFLLKPYPNKSFQFPSINASSATNSSISGSSTNHHLPPPPPSSNFGLSNFHSVLQSQLAAKAQMMPPTPSSTAAGDYGSVGDLGQLTGVVGSGLPWGQDAGAHPTAQLRQVSNGGCKLNYSAAGEAAVEFCAEKGGDARGEGMVESWICSSD